MLSLALIDLSTAARSYFVERHQRMYEDFLRAANAGVQALDSVKRSLDRDEPRAKPATQCTHELLGVSHVAIYCVVNTEINRRRSVVRARPAALEQNQQVFAADEGTVQNTSSACALQTAVPVLLDQAAGGDALPTRPAQHDPTDGGVRCSTVDQRAAGAVVA